MNEQETIESHQLLCLDVVTETLNKLYNVLGGKLCKFRIEESDKNYEFLNLVGNFFLTHFIIRLFFLRPNEPTNISLMGGWMGGWMVDTRNIIEPVEPINNILILCL